MCGDEVLATGFADQPGRDDVVFGVGAGGEWEGEGGVFRRCRCDIALWAFEEDSKDAVGLEANRTFATAGGSAINFGSRYGAGDPGEGGSGGLTCRRERGASPVGSGSLLERVDGGVDDVGSRIVVLGDLGVTAVTCTKLALESG